MNFLKKLFQGQPRRQRIDLARRFDLIGRVGQGSMSKVWRARDSQSGRIVALKVLDKEKTERLEARFTGLNKPTEGEIAVQLQHAHIVRTFEYGWTRKYEQFLVMEFVEGIGLSYLVDVQNETMRRCRLRFLCELADAIRHIHEKNWIHRDVCPRNVLIDPDQHVKLIDFGLVVPNTPGFRKPGNRTGTANYMAPELIKRLTTDERIDIFSYAVTAYEAFTRRLPWDAAESLDAVLQHINAPPDDIREHAPGVDHEVADIIMKGLERDPRDRWPSMKEMLESLAAARLRLEPDAEPLDLSAAHPGTGIVVETTQPRILFLCTGNSCRSQMAEGLLRHLAGDRYEALSAGAQPAGYVHPLAVQVMQEIGIDIAGQHSKPITDFLPPRGQPPDVIVSVCSSAAEACPTFPAAVERLELPFDDPAHASGNEQQQLGEFRRARDEIRAALTTHFG